jgi:hypothetical protein
LSFYVVIIGNIIMLLIATKIKAFFDNAIGKTGYYSATAKGSAFYAKAEKGLRADPGYRPMGNGKGIPRRCVSLGWRIRG